MARTDRAYTEEHIDTLLDLYFRNHPRPAPYPAIAKCLGVPADGLDDLLWKVVTGYQGKDPAGPRRVYTRTAGRRSREGFPWFPREDKALTAALGGEGQRRDPPVDVAYCAAVLARTVAEVANRWAQIRDPLQRGGFGLGG